MKERTFHKAYTTAIFITGLIITTFSYFTGDTFYLIPGILICLLSIIHWLAIKDKLKQEE